MADIAYWHDEYSKEANQFASTSTALNSLITSNSTNNRKIIKLISECDTILSKIKDVKTSFNLELKLVKDRAEKQEYDRLKKALDDKVMFLTKDLKLIKMKQNKQELFEETANRRMFSTDGKGNDELLDGANELQDKTFESLTRTQLMIQNSKEVGTATLEELRRQKDQIKDIEAEVDVIDSNLKRAEVLLFNFTRRMATDKLIQGFATINIVVMLGLVLYIAISGKSLSASSKPPYAGPSQTSSNTTALRPTMMPVTASPSFRPSMRPTAMPTFLPSFLPTAVPTHKPTFAPTFLPTFLPTPVPTPIPTPLPSQLPTRIPTQVPTVIPTSLPTLPPTQPSAPTAAPS